MDNVLAASCIVVVICEVGQAWLTDVGHVMQADCTVAVAELPWITVTDTT